MAPRHENAAIMAFYIHSIRCQHLPAVILLGLHFLQRRSPVLLYWKWCNEIFLPTKSFSSNSNHKLQWFIKKLKHIQQLRATPTSNHSAKPTFVYRDLSVCSHVFLRA
ncbi:hypothetical protein AVEN_166021-1 [Araneus ventricosus]|uniref:Uncharacterized protein n=1 Tax=Araneus ventricosus TaxID=182803 RepID=A0A4Y2L550_ARAVE|nr:hypothetical protein AVEN_166021-1 [Araneus ventricosus]